MAIQHTLASVVATALVCGGSITSPTASSQSPTLGDVLARAAQYVATYDRALGTIIAEERYEQRVADIRLAFPAGRQPITRRLEWRRLRSDFLILRLPGDDDVWLGFRDVFEVDGKPVRDRQERFQRLFQDTPERTVEALRRLSDESARFNIGGVRRNINVPTFALTVLRAEHQPRFAFEKREDGRLRGQDVWVVAFREQTSPTLIRNERGEDVASYGRIWIASRDGLVVRTELEATAEKGQLRSRIAVEFASNRRLGLWVPADMEEDYEAPNVGSIEARARYSNFRRFEVTVKVRE